MEAVSACVGFIRSFDEIIREHSIPRSLPLNLPHVTYNQRFPIQMDDSSLVWICTLSTDSVRAVWSR